MATIHRSLETVAASYSLFERNQVLTHDQLNSVGAYLDDQSRLTRLALAGVGIVCGLRLGRRGGAVVLAKGVGLTTDGDLLHVGTERVYDRVRLYDASRPAYPPFYGGDAGSGTILPLYELIGTGERDDGRMERLDAFAARTGFDPNAMVGVLYMESARTDFDLCTGTDCDNLGQECTHTLRLFLVEEGRIGALRERVVTPDQAVAELAEIVAARPVFTATANTPNLLAQTFRTACTAMYRGLSAQLPRLYPACSTFLGDLFGTDPAPAWLERLARWQEYFAANGLPIQSYHGFLKDLVETWNEFRSRLAGDRTWCCPDPLAFPKHLLLGRVGDTGGGERLRTPFYPSPLVSRTQTDLHHARFLVSKLDVLIRTFEPLAETTIRITPSGGAVPLEERAIPAYYRFDPALPIHAWWNFRLTQRSMATANYGYHANRYGATGAAANPLAASLGRFPFFRVEGHLGQPAADVARTLNDLITRHNLPIAVGLVALSADRRRVIKRPGIRYTDLHRLHYLFRQDVSRQLADVVRFSQNFKQKVDKAVRTEVIADAADETGVTLTGYAKDQNSAVARNAAKVRTVLNRPYSRYSSDASWKTSVAPTMQAAGLFKSRLSEVVKTEFTTPFDSLIGNDRIQWLDWLDDIIKAKEDKADDRLLFAAFFAEHPGIEHGGGVERGGTLVLLYDEEQRVVADVMLPYRWVEAEEEEPAQPPIRKPGLRPGWVIGNGLTVLPSRHALIRDALVHFRNDEVETLLQSRLAGFKAAHVDTLRSTIETGLNARVDALQKDYLGTVKESANLLGSALIGRKDLAAGVDAGQLVFADKELQARVEAVREQELVTKYLADKASQRGLTEAQQTLYQQQAREAEADLARAIADTTQYLADSKTSVAVGSEGMAAMLTLNNGLATISDTQAMATVNDRLNTIKTGSTDAGLTMMIDAMTSTRIR